MSNKRTSKATGRAASKSSKSSRPAETTAVPQEIRRNIYSPARERGMHSRILNTNG